MRRVRKYYLESKHRRRNLLNRCFKLAQKLKTLVERLDVFLKKPSEKSEGIVFKTTAWLLNVTLHMYKTNFTHSYLIKRLKTQLMISTVIIGTVQGFVCSWLLTCTGLLVLRILILTLLIQNITQKVLNERDYLKFK